MKTPPFLLGAALLFWGWQSDFLLVGLAMGVLLELPRFVRFRWDLDDADFSRIWGFCAVLNAALMAYAFTNNEDGGLNGMLHGNIAANVANSSAQTTTRFLSLATDDVFCRHHRGTSIQSPRIRSADWHFAGAALASAPGR